MSELELDLFRNMTEKEAETMPSKTKMWDLGVLAPFAVAILFGSFSRIVPKRTLNFTYFRKLCIAKITQVKKIKVAELKITVLKVDSMFG